MTVLRLLMMPLAQGSSAAPPPIEAFTYPASHERRQLASVSTVIALRAALSARVPEIELASGSYQLGESYIGSADDVTLNIAYSVTIRAAPGANVILDAERICSGCRVLSIMRA